MTQIIAGRFQTSGDADEAAVALARHGLPSDRVSVFYVTPPGQHDATPVGGDEAESEGLEHADSGAAKGAAIGVTAGIAGAIIGATAGLATPVIAAAALGVAAAGAYGGSLAGAMHGADDPGKHRIRHAGMMVAVDASALQDQRHEDDAATKIVALLKDHGAVDIEHADGTWANGTWDDFDPTRPPHLVDGPQPMVANPGASD